LVQIEVERTIQAPAGTLWTYLSTAKGLSAWHADEVRGELARGEFLARYPSLGAELTLKVLAVEPGRAITLGAGTSRVEITLTGLDQAGCRVKITHSGLDLSDDLDGFRASWALALGLLDLAVVRHLGEPRSVRWFFATSPVPPGLVHYYFSSRQGLAEWLGAVQADVGTVGSGVELELEGGTRLSGEVICHETGRDVCLRWREQGDAALVLRTLPGGPSERQLALSVSTFGGKLDPKVAQTLDKALLRLVARLRGRGQS
jgi:uncharacterized protein YndB with AHSA1/START domain